MKCLVHRKPSTRGPRGRPAAAPPQFLQRAPLHRGWGWGSGHFLSQNSPKAKLGPISPWQPGPATGAPTLLLRGGTCQGFRDL